MKTEYASVYQDNRQARREHVVWLKDIEELRAKNSQVLALLAQIEGLVRQYDAELQIRAAEIGTHELQIQLHETALGNPEHPGSGPAFNEFATAHEQFKDRHTELQQNAVHYKRLSVECANEVRPLLESLGKLI